MMMKSSLLLFVTFCFVNVNVAVTEEGFEVSYGRTHTPGGFVRGDAAVVLMVGTAVVHVYSV